LEKAAFIIYLVTLTISPLLFGAVHTYVYTLMAIGVLTGTLLLVMKNIKKDLKTGIYRFQLPNTSLNVLFLIMTGFLIIQVIPLPDFIIRFLSPEAWMVEQKSLPASSSIIPGNRSEDWCAFAPYYYPVRMSIIRFTVYGLFFFGLTQVLNSRRRIELTISLILITGCFEALYGLMQTYSGSEHIWWFKKRAHLGDVTGTYVNRNHFAGLMEMGLLLAACYSAALSLRGKKRKIISGHTSSLRGRISRYLSGEQRFNKRTLMLFAGVVMGIGLFFSASRGGLIATAGAMLCLSLLLVFRKDHRQKGVIIFTLFFITALYALHIGVEYPLGRFKYFDASFEDRSRYAQKTMAMFKDYSLAGIGAGNFRYAYPKYQAAEDKNIFLRHAHNDWAQFFAETGVAGLCLFLVGILYFFYRTIKLWRKRGDPFAICLGAAPIAVMIAIAIHSLSDFNLHIPANFLMLAAITAIGYSSLHSERHHGGDRTLYRYHIIPLKYKGMMVLIPVLGFIAWNGFWSIRHFVAEAYCDTVGNSTLNRDQNPRLAEIDEAISWDGSNAGYWYKRAWGLVRIRKAFASKGGTLSDEKNLKRQMEVIRALERAVRLNPFEAQYHFRLGWEYIYLQQDPDYLEKWLPAADLCMERAVHFAGTRDPRIYVNIGNYWIYRSKTIRPTDPKWEIAWANACWNYRNAQGLERRKSLADSIVKYVWRFYPDVALVRKVLHADHKNLPDVRK
jgi:O-antigen ligase